MAEVPTATLGQVHRLVGPLARVAAQTIENVDTMLLFNAGIHSVIGQPRVLFDRLCNQYLSSYRLVSSRVFISHQWHYDSHPDNSVIARTCKHSGLRRMPSNNVDAARSVGFPFLDEGSVCAPDVHFRICTS